MGASEACMKPVRGNYTVPAVFFLLTLLTRLPLADPVLLNMDSIHFAMALDTFDVTLHQPHPPGYFLYVMMGRLARLVLSDDNRALVGLSILFSSLAVPLVYSFGRRMYGRSEGIAAAVIALVSPLLWYHGIVALSYAAECFLSLLIAWLCYRITRGETGLVWACSVLLGLAGGVRQTTIVFMLPLWLYSIRHIGARRIILAALTAALSFTAWFLPMLNMTGGYGNYRMAVDTLLHRAVWRGVAPSFVLGNLRIQLFWVAWGLLAALIPLCSLLLSRIRGRVSEPVIPEPAFFWLWLGPSLAFYILVMSKEQNPGYSLVYMPALYLLAGKAMTAEAGRLARSLKRPGLDAWRVWVLMLAAVVALNTAAFTGLRFNYSYRGVTAFRRLTEIYMDGLRAHFPPDRTVVVGWEHVYVSYRHVAYYLPEYIVYYIPMLDTPEGGYYLRCYGGKTARSDKIVIPDSTEYVVYYVPNTKGVPESAKRMGAAAMPIGGGYRMIYFRYGALKASGVPVDKALLDLGYDEDI